MSSDHIAQRDDVLWWIGLGLLSSYGVLLIFLWDWVPLVPLALILAVLLFAFTIVHPPETLAVVLVLLGAAGLPLGARGIDIGVRVYILDFVVGLLLASTVIGTAVNPARWKSQWFLRGAFVGLLLYLSVSLAHGLQAGNDVRFALGEYRRMALYPTTLFVFAGCVHSRDHAEKLLRAIVIGAYVTAVIAVVRILSGVGYTAPHLEGTTIRYLSYIEASTAGVGVIVAVGFARVAVGRGRVVWWLVALPLFASVLVSNYRTAWIGLGVGLMAAGMVLGFKRALPALLKAAAVLVPLTYVIVVHTALGKAVLDRFDLVNLSSSGLWRYYSWRAAIDAWLPNPLLGTGLGYAHQFQFFSLEGGHFSVSTTGSIHNAPLRFLVNNGLVGLTIAAFFVVPWLRRAAHLARSSERNAAMVGTTALGSLALMITVSCFQPFFSTAATVAIAMALVAIVLRAEPPTDTRMDR